MALNIAFFENGRPSPDQVAFKKYMAERKSNPPYGLIRYMYRYGREKAVDAVGTVYGNEAISPHASTDKRGLAAVKDVASGGLWWEELYAAEQMKQNPKLRDPELMKQLKKSKNPVVSATIKEIEDERK